MPFNLFGRIPLAYKLISFVKLINSFSFNWEEQKIAGKKLKTNLVTCWRNNKLYYKYAIYPYESLKKLESLREFDYSKYSVQKFIILLLDENDFVIKEIPILLKDMTTLVDKKGDPQAKEINSNSELEKSDYAAISTYNSTWNFDKELVPNFKIMTKYLYDFYDFHVDKP